jgi:hypothetical protein
MPFGFPSSGFGGRTDSKKAGKRVTGQFNTKRRGYQESRRLFVPDRTAYARDPPGCDVCIIGRGSGLFVTVGRVRNPQGLAEEKKTADAALPAISER